MENTSELFLVWFLASVSGWVVGSFLVPLLVFIKETIFIVIARIFRNIFKILKKEK